MTDNPISAIHSHDFKRYIDNNGIPEHALPRWIDAILQKTESSECGIRYCIEGLEIECWASDPGHLEWLSKYLHPFMQPTREQMNLNEHFKIGYFFSEEIIRQALEFIDSGVMDSSYVFSSKTQVTRLVFSSHLIADYDPDKALLWLTDLENRTLTMVASTHVCQPYHHLGRCVRDVVTHYLRAEGWDSYHAGAIETQEGIFLVIGDQRAGKTSLILAMINGGAKYIANDRIFIKVIDDTPHVLSFPMAVATGLGTALQYDALKRYITSPLRLSHPCNRLDQLRVSETPEKYWHELPDKIQIFPCELERDFGSSSLQGGKISGILFPSMSETTPLRIQEKEISSAASTLKSNRFPCETDNVVPVWRPLDFAAFPEETVLPLQRSLLRLPLINFQYFASKNRKNEMKTYPQALSHYLQKIKGVRLD